jgi:hypothetical protein
MPQWNKVNPFETELADGNSGAAFTVVWPSSSHQTLTLTANTTLTFSAPVGGCELILRLVQDGTGGRTVTFPGTVVGTPIIAAAINAVTVLKFYFNGTSYYLLSSTGATGPDLTLAGDVVGPSNANTVDAISGPSPILITPAELEWTSTTVAPEITQAALASTSAGAGAVGQTMTIEAQAGQAATGGTNAGGNGGPLALQCAPGGASGGGTAGSAGFVDVLNSTGAVMWQLGALVGTPSAGAIYPGNVTPSATNYAVATTNSTQLTVNNPTNVNIAIAGTNLLGVNAANVVFLEPIRASGTAVSWGATSVALTTSTGNVLTSSQYNFPTIKFTGTLTGAGTTITFPSIDGAFWNLDFSAIVFNGNSIALIANSVTWSGAANISGTATAFPRIRYTAGAARLVGTFDLE